MYRDHRKRYLQRLQGEGAAAVFANGSPPTRNNDCEYRFRPDSDFWYLTGFAEQDSFLVLLPGHPTHECVLFLRERDPAMETWNGKRLGVERAAETLGVDLALPVDALWDELPDLLEGYSKVVYRTGLDEKRDREMLALLAMVRGRTRQGRPFPAAFEDPSLTLHEQRLFKTEPEIAAMRHAGTLAAEAHRAVMLAAQPGKNEAELDALIDFTFRKNGSTGQAYNNIVAGGANACILHYVENDQELRDGDLVLVDAGAEWEYYASDVTRTWPVSGTFTEPQRQLYEVVLEAQLAAIEGIRPGATFVDVHLLALERLCRGLMNLGLVQGTLEEVLGERRYEPFYMHKTSHWLGLDVHDCGSYVDAEGSRKLEPGIVLTVEPGLYVPEDADVDPRWRGIGIRIEDDVLVTKDGYEVLTPGVAKSVDEVEALCQGRELASSPS